MTYCHAGHISKKTQPLNVGLVVLINNYINTEFHKIQQIRKDMPFDRFDFLRTMRKECIIALTELNIIKESNKAGMYSVSSQALFCSAR